MPIRLVPLLLLVMVTACRTTSEESSQARDAKNVQDGGYPGGVDPRLALECPPKEIVCEREDTASLCVVTSHDGRELPESLVLRAWGDSVCAATLAIAKEACARGLGPSGLATAQCAPDASAGNCPAASVACADGGEPTVCTASRYADQALSPGQALKAWGDNPCLARAALSGVACARNLNPERLGEVQCATDPQGGECQLTEVFCQDARRDATCEVRRLINGALDTPLIVQGISSCDARQRLLRQACRRGIKPSDIDDIVCRFGE